MYDAARSCAEAHDIEAEAGREWRRAGRPMLSENPNGAAGVHPLFKALLEARREASRCRVEVGLVASAKTRASKGGRPVGASSAKDRPAAAKVVRLHG